MPSEKISRDKPDTGPVEEEIPEENETKEVEEVDQKKVLSLTQDNSNVVQYKPIWAEDAFLAEFADAFVDHTDIYKVKSLTITPSLTFLQKALSFVLAKAASSDLWLNPIKPDQLIWLEKMNHVMADALDLARQFPIGSESEEELYKFLQTFMFRVLRMTNKDVMIIPGGWLKNRNKRHGMIYVLQRLESTWKFTLINLGEGLEYHPSTAAFPPKIKRKVSLVFDDIPLARLNDSSFWFFLFRMQIWPSAGHNAKTLYCHLAPALNAKPFNENINQDDSFTEWRSTPRAPQETALYRCVKEAFHFCLRSVGFSPGLTKYIGVLLRWGMCHMVVRDLARSVSIRGSEMHLIKIACHQVAHHASKQASKYSILQAPHLRVLKKTIGLVHAAVAKVYQPNTTALPPILEWEGQVMKSRPYPLFDRFYAKSDGEEYVGGASLPPIQRPIELTLVKDSVTTPEEIALMLRHCDHLCTLMSFQTTHVKNTYTLRLALIQHLFTVTLPIPLPYNHPNKAQCLWVQPMRYETQVDILRSISMLARHFSACAFSVQINRSFDTRRIITMACMSVMSDAVMRVIASDVPSQLCIHYSGQAEGPSYPFGFDIGYFEIQSSMMEFSDPGLIVARTQLLDYFVTLKDIVHEDHIIFDFETRNNVGNAEKWFQQICYEIGFPAVNCHLYLCSNQSQILDFYPELMYFRDIVYMFKYMLTPDVEVFPEIRPWAQIDAKLHWTFDEKTGYVVRAFKRNLVCKPSTAALEETKRKQDEQTGLFSGLIGRLSKLFSSEVSRVAPSPSDPSILAQTEINNEDDVLHVPKLPNFDQRLSQRSSEALLSFLTVPYLRIPLILNFFASEDKIRSLRSPSLRAVLDAVLFEPSHWQGPKEKLLPDMIPFKDRSFLATPCGLLFNELIVSPSGVCKSLIDMLAVSLDMDTGRYTDSTSSVICFVIRLVVRVEAFLIFLIKHNTADVDRLSGTGWKSFVRGLQSPHTKVIKLLYRVRTNLRNTLNKRVFPMLETWASHATRKQEIIRACKIHAHICYLYKNLAEDELTEETVGIFLSSQIFLTTRFSYTVDAPKSHNTPKDRKEAQKELKTTEQLLHREEEDAQGLGIPQVEMFDIFQQQRGKMISWMEEHPTESNEVFESIVRVVTFTGQRSKSINDPTPFHWRSLIGKHCRGRCVPLTEAGLAEFETKVAQLVKEQAEDDVLKRSSSNSDDEDVLQSKRWNKYRLKIKVKNIDRHEPYDKFMRDRQDKIQVHTEINVQLGDFTLKTQRLQILDERICEMTDFKTVFGDVKASIQCAEVKTTQNRTWMRLVGRRHDIQLWNPHMETEKIPDFTRKYSPKLGSSEMWIVNTLEPCRGVHLKDVELFLPDTHHPSKAGVARLIGIVKPRKGVKKKGGEKKTEKNNTKEDEKKEINRSTRSKTIDGMPHTPESKMKAILDELPTVKEIVVFRSPKVVHIYNVIEYGRRFYRTLVYSSNARYCLHDLEPRLILSKEWKEEEKQYRFSPQYESGDPLIPVRNESSLVVLRNVNPSIGEETFIPSRLLYGLLPTALLEQYVMWQNSSGDLVGETIHSETDRSPSILKVRLREISSSVATATVSRIPVNIHLKKQTEIKKKTESEEEMLREDQAASTATLVDIKEMQNETNTVIYETDKEEVLLNLLYAPPDTVLAELGKLLMRLENLSHCLAWSKKGSNSIDRIELPRLRLSFVSKTGYIDGKEITRLYSSDHAGLFISNFRCNMTKHLLEGIPHSLILENVDHDLFVLVPGAALPIRPSIIEDRFPTDIVFDRRNQEWLDNIDVRHYLYPIHQSKTFLFTPTLASALYLLLLRFLTRQYDKVFELAASCVTDGELSMEEEQIFNQLEYVKNDFHANAHAARLKIWLATMDTKMICPWNVTTEFEFYLSKLSHVSFTCRLTFDEEIVLLESMKRRSCELVNRYRFLRGIITNKQVINSALPRAVNIGKEFDHIIDKSIISSSDSAFESLHTTSYRRPVQKNEEAKQILYYSGVEAMKMMNFWMTDGWKLSGGKHNLGFLFFYELLTQSLPFSFLNGDNTHNLACVLIRMLPSNDVLNKSVEMSILRILASNPELAFDRDIPKFEDTRSKYTIATMFKGGNSDFARLIKGLKQFFIKSKDKISWPIINKKPVPTIKCFIPTNAMKSRQWLTTNGLSDYSCSEREFIPPETDQKIGMTRADYDAFCTAPLSVIKGGLSHYISVKTRAERGLPPVTSTLPFDISHSPLASNYVAVDTLKRLQSDCMLHSKKENEGAQSQLIGICDEDVQSFVNNPVGPEIKNAKEKLKELLNSLHELQESDDEYVSKIIRAILLLSNHTGDNESLDISSLSSSRSGRSHRSRLAFILSRYAGHEYTFTFEKMITLLLSSNAEEEIKGMNPYLTDKELNRVMQLTVDSLMHSNRLGQLHRCLTAARILMEDLIRLEQTKSLEKRMILGQELVLKANGLASLMSAKRHYIREVEREVTIKTAASGEEVKEGDEEQVETKIVKKKIYDPRFLLFEFTYNLMLRKSQVSLVDQFILSFQQDESRCHQMIMGAGKTTVVAPLLTLILADGKRLVTQVVPPALLEFSRSIMRSRFSAILRKPVYTFHFDRFTAVNKDFFTKLDHASLLKAVVITTPASLKSFLLKFVEILHHLDQSKVLMRTQRGIKEKTSRVKLHASLGFDPSLSDRDLLELLVNNARICFNTLRLFRRGVLLLDEVDLILHPLKSELNWPLGEKTPLDFTIGSLDIGLTSGKPSSVTRKEGNGLRWEIPNHLLDAIFYAQTGKMSVAYTDSKDAYEIVEKIKSVIEEGASKRLLQRTPHLVLLSKEFYHKVLKPLLAYWMMLWLETNGVTGLTREEIQSYLLTSGNDNKELSELVNTKLAGEYVKMLNLSFDWLHSFTPHVFSKIDRVSFGLLTMEECKQMAITDPKMPFSRRVLAIPFIGKDVPSRSSEFSHPDVVMGLTIMAYRYEGLRESDMKQIIRELRNEMEEQAGPFNKRKTCRLFAKWVKYAGGHVRGWKREKIQKNVHNMISQNNTQQQKLEEKENEDELIEVWPLQLIDLSDPEQFGTVFDLLRRQPHIIYYYLTEFIFPETSKHQGMKLSASAQCLGGELLFKHRIGFSGTPSDLLPLEFGKCHYERGTDGNMLRTLTNTNVVTYEKLPTDWKVSTILDRIATAEPPFHALIDTGALITGLSNIEVASYLLIKGLNGMEGVVFLDEFDRQMVLIRSTMRVMTLMQCGISIDKRFTFYDQIHTTGMDIKQTINACAVVTLGKDMVFRDYAQGVFRMRGIGLGQTVRLFMIPEVRQLINGSMVGAKEVEMNIKEDPITKKHRLVLSHVCAWLILNTIKAERVQFNMLTEQNMHNIWRKKAFDCLMNTYGEIGADHCNKITEKAVDTFRQRVDHRVENIVPVIKPFATKLAEATRFHSVFLEDTDMKILNEIKQMLLQAEGELMSASDKQNLADAALLSFEAEQVNQQEQEQQQQQEQEQEQEQEMEQEQEEFPSEVFSQQNYSRKDEYLKEWSFNSLDEDPEKNKQGFYPLSQFQVFRGGLTNNDKAKPLLFPSNIIVSSNYFDTSWSLKSHRRIKNIFVVMEWIPNREIVELQTVESILKDDTYKDVHQLTDLQEDRVRRAYELLKQKNETDNDDNISLTRDEMKNVLLTCDVPYTNDEDLDSIIDAIEEETKSEEIRLERKMTGYEKFRHMLLYHTYGRWQNKRYYVVLSLLEAESIRGHIHSRRGQSIIEDTNTSISLRTGDYILDASLKHQSSCAYQTAVVDNCCRFFDSEMYFTISNLHLLLKPLQHNSCKEREIWFQQVRQCRRRDRKPWWESPLAQAFILQDEWRIVEYKATMLRIKTMVEEKHMMMLDAFRAFDYDNNGYLSCSELYGGLTWLNFPIGPPQIHDLVRMMDLDCDGKISMRDFSRSFSALGFGGDDDDEDLDDLDTIHSQGTGEFNRLCIQPRQMEELNSEWQTSLQASVREKKEIKKLLNVTADGLKQLEINMVACPSLISRWNSLGTMSRYKVSMWTADTSSKWYRNNSAFVNLGLYAFPGYSQPNKDIFFTIEVVDNSKTMFSSSDYLTPLLNALFPHPVKYHQAWSQQRGKRPLYLWQPLPPTSDFVALGVVGTSSPIEPSATAVRCVPKKWLQKTSMKPKLVWNDSGTSGRAGSIWQINSMGLMAVADGHEAPTGTYYDLKKTKFRISPEDMKIVRVELGKHEPQKQK